mmetsp:Transcript_19080/g.53384  ORF Transcript_19080/g.53384 Transcript_19080/m.53384 type:complete len:295 (+) Transcript_19080:121-1005(+)
MLPKFDGLSDTSQTVFRKNPLHMQQGSPSKRALRLHELSSSANWASTGNSYGSWAKQDESNIESSHIADINMARNFARYGGPRPGMVTRSVSEPRLGAAGSAAPSPMGAGMPQGLLTGRSSAGSQADGDDSESASPSSRRFLERRPQFNTHNMLLPGETSLQQAFPGAPGASIGVRSGQQAKWSFERAPSLLHAPLLRDTGRMGRSCAGMPPRGWQATASDSDATPPASFRPTGAASGASGGATAGGFSTISKQGLGRTSSTSGFQAVIGMTWDGAAIRAGGATRGSDGKYLGH